MIIEPKPLRKLRKHVALAEYAIAVAQSEATWATKYNTIFSEEVSEALPAIGWYDPDADYEADVRSYIEALEEALGQWRLILQSVDGKKGGERDG